MERRGCARPRRIFPLGLAQQAIRLALHASVQPVDIGHRLNPGDIDHRDCWLLPLIAACFVARFIANAPSGRDARIDLPPGDLGCGSRKGFNRGAPLWAFIILALFLSVR